MAGASVILLWAVPFLFYHAPPGAMPSWLTSIALAIQLGIVTALFAGKWKPRHRIALAMGVLACVIVVTNLPWVPVRVVERAAAGGCHALAYTGLLIWFGSSLLPNREPVVTGFARRLRRTMPDKVTRYTRHVTIAWCVFFTAQLGVSALLLLTAPETVWTTFVSLLNMPLLVAMILAEFSVRLILFRHETHTSLIDTVLAMRRGRAMSGDRS